MTLGSKLLSEWRAKSALSQTEAATRFGVSQPGYWAWERGAVPKIEQGLHIEKVTSGAVPLASWAIEIPKDELAPKTEAEA